MAGYSTKQKSAYTPHDPIFIGGNSAFTTVNGVTGGSGTQADPYIIEGWDIDASTAHGIYIENTDKYFIIRNCAIHDGKSKSKDGIYFYNVTNSEIDNVTSYNNYDGIYLSYFSNNNIIANCNVYNNKYYGICLGSSSDNLIVNCNVYNTKWSGILLDQSPNNIIRHCMVYNNGCGIWLSSSSNNTITNNNVVANGRNANGGDHNLWDNGSVGNYWSDYTGRDDNGDGIGDSPYKISRGNKDRYPLMFPVVVGEKISQLKHLIREAEEKGISAEKERVFLQELEQKLLQSKTKGGP